MKQIKIFKTNNKKMVVTQNDINDWIESENIDVHSIETARGIEYRNSSFSSFDEVEIFIIVLYSKLD